MSWLVLSVLSQLPCLCSPVPNATSLLSCHGCPIFAALSYLSCPCFGTGHTVLCLISWLHFSDCLFLLSYPVLPILSACPVPAVLSKLFSIILVPSSPVPTVPHLSRLVSQSSPSTLTCLSCPVIADVMSEMPCPNFTVTAVLPRLSHLSYPVPAALFCHVLAIVFFFPVLPVPFQVYSLIVLPKLSCLGFPVAAVLPQHSCPQLFCL
jgi:hypothetical protein